MAAGKGKAANPIVFVKALNRKYNSSGAVFGIDRVSMWRYGIFRYKKAAEYREV